MYRLPGPFSTLLVTVLLVLAAHPFLKGFGGDMLNLAFAVMLISALRSLKHPPWAFKVGLGLMVPALALIALQLGSVDPRIRFGGEVLVLVAFLFTSFMMVVDTMQARTVTVEQISSSLAAYVLFGLVWTLAFFMLETYVPGSLSIGETSRDGLFDACIYFSFVTLTTLGYGDILPLSEAARALAYSEAILGQLYLAVLVAKLVGMYTAEQMKKDR